MNRNLRLLILCAVMASPAAAQPFSMTWFSVDAGVSETSTGAGFSLQATVGQPDAMDMVMVGGGFSLQGGFWANFGVGDPGCPADIDGDGDADADDFFAYLDAFAGGNAAVCDIDDDGDCDADDFFGYLDLFAQGC